MTPLFTTASLDNNVVVELFVVGLPGTPERKGELDSSVFKTPLPATASKKAKSAAKSRYIGIQRDHEKFFL